MGRFSSPFVNSYGNKGKMTLARETIANRFQVRVAGGVGLLNPASFPTGTKTD